MANNIYFSVLAFSRTQEHEFRAEAAIKALSKEHARSAAAHLTGYGRGTVAFSITGEPSTAKWDAPEIIARFGDLPDNGALHQELSRVWSTERSEGNGALARPLANVRPTAHSLRRLWSSAIPISDGQQRSVLGSSKRSLVVAGLVIVGLAASGSVMLIRTASAAQREARLMEMARPACVHSGITNDELRHAVRSELEAGTNKKDALSYVVTLCRTKPGLG